MIHLNLDPDTDIPLSPYELSLYIGMLYTLSQRHHIQLLQAVLSQGSAKTLILGAHEAAIATHVQLVIFNRIQS